VNLIQCDDVKSFAMDFCKDIEMYATCVVCVW